MVGFSVNLLCYHCGRWTVDGGRWTVVTDPLTTDPLNTAPCLSEKRQILVRHHIRKTLVIRLNLC